MTRLNYRAGLFGRSSGLPFLSMNILAVEVRRWLGNLQKIPAYEEKGRFAKGILFTPENTFKKTGWQGSVLSAGRTPLSRGWWSLSRHRRNISPWYQPLFFIDLLVPDISMILSDTQQSRKSDFPLMC